ncbi:prostaglandin E receptor 2b subtype EP2 isoform X2 [Xiphias gladius]|uniref:prostaglandin E receptor 2b subtype EP2 isoform X2 n=1 Tax=Xiphias gladius TaxID=8245 RepID=UPI001A98E08D|nr:prostaglandin E receptor 2b subtype EP2 isoform X2 [Xiphias gladius]
MENYNTNPRCRDAVEPRKPITPGLMFSATLVGNILALVLLHVRRRRTSPSLYKVLVTALLMTDLLGSISVSPVVLSAYAQNKSLLEMGTDNKVCSYFGFSMTFLSLSTLAMLCVMALERYVSIGHPYFYGRHLSKRCGYITIAFIYLSSILFCIIPFMGQGKYKQYAPGTWCFLDMATKDFRLYIGFYASFILIIITTTVVCNVYVIFLLVSMYRRGKVRRRGVSARPRCHRSLSMTEEVEHLLPLAIITVVFICCTFPLVLQTSACWSAFVCIQSGFQENKLGDYSHNEVKCSCRDIDITVHYYSTGGRLPLFTFPEAPSVHKPNQRRGLS